MDMRFGSTLDAPPPPVPGQAVRVRTRRFLVEDVTAPPTPGDATLVRLACLEDDAQGETLEVLWEHEVDAEALPEGAGQLALGPRGFDAPRLFAAYLDTLRWNSVTATDPRLFQSPWRAGIGIKTYQLEPLRQALELPRVNLFIADDVGLGKTIEAGLILSELLLRQKVRRVVVCCPPSVVLQWRDEMEQRFGLLFQIMDRAYVGQKRRARGYGINPWSTHSRFILSHALLRDESYQSGLRQWLEEGSAPALLIVDEAHNAAPASGARYAVDSQFTHALRQVAALFEHRLFLSATPHNGHSNSFTALLEMLDPQRFCRGVGVRHERARLAEVMVRRLKRDLRDAQIEGFPRRVPVQIDIRGLPEDAPELRLPAVLERYVEARARRLQDASKSAQAAAALVTTALQKRLLSSVEAFARTLAVHVRSVERQLEGAPVPALPEPRLRPLAALLDAPGPDDERATAPEQDQQAEESAALEALTAASSASASTSALASERALLDELTALAETARRLPDARVQHLVAWIRRELCPGTPPHWNARRLLIFTEYVDTQRYLVQQLRAALITQGALGDDPDETQHARLAVFHGQLDDERREELKHAFNAAPEREPLRILVATDAAREGLNLQNHCADLVHFDVPWNPSRMEQRNGRIDRVGQQAPEVRCHYFFHVQRPHDRVLQALVQKSDTIARELGSLAPVLDARLERLLAHGIRGPEVDDLTSAIRGAQVAAEAGAVAREELEQARPEAMELRQRLHDLRGDLERSEQALGFDEQAFRDALSCALELLGAEPLAPAGPDRWTVPALDRQPGADPTWADTLDSLRPPKPRELPLWEWRRSAPLRPVVFRDPGRLDETAVHLHLEQRLVRRLLGRFLAQGFVHHDLTRVCVVPSSLARPRVLLIGRLALYGAQAARLHDQLVLLSAPWSDPQVRPAALVPDDEDQNELAWQRLHEALRAHASHAVPAHTQALLAAALPRDLADLQPQLEARAQTRARAAAAQLEARGDAEARAMTTILRTQRAHVQSQIQTEQQRRAADERQQRLPFEGYDEREARQIEADLRHWKKRLERLDHELAHEPERVRQVYAIKATRIELAGLVYLWPVTG
jgi:superfamily II DNA or RNA helicase